MRILGRSAAAVALLAGAAVLPATPARAASCAEPGDNITAVPWAQQRLTPERIWPFTRGGGVKVAVLASGVDGNQPQLRGHVDKGFDAVAGKGDANNDCLGFGTQIAGVIAAQPQNGVGLVGLAPGVTIVPVRVFGDTSGGTSGGTPTYAPGAIQKGIDWAVDQGVDVIDIVAPFYNDSAEVRASVARALDRGVVVVAAAGDLPTDKNPDQSLVIYPAAYPGVIGVGAIDPTGARFSGSPMGPMIDLVAPGAGVVAPQIGHGMIETLGTGVASGFVAAAAALVRARYGKSTNGAEVERRLTATASPAAGTGPAYGHGAVNAYAAVTEQLTKASPTDPPAMGAPPEVDAGALAARRHLAMSAAGIGILVSFVVLALALALPLARRRRWRSAVAAPLPSRPDVEPGPPVQLFDEPSP